MRSGWTAAIVNMPVGLDQPRAPGVKPPLYPPDGAGDYRLFAKQVHRAVESRWPVLGPPLSLAARPVGWHHYRLAGGMLFRAEAVAFCSPPHGDTSATVGGTRSCRAAWSARHPVKVEVAGSNPVRTAGIQ